MIMNDELFEYFLQSDREMSDDAIYKTYFEQPYAIKNEGNLDDELTNSIVRDMVHSSGLVTTEMSLHMMNQTIKTINKQYQVIL